MMPALLTWVTLYGCGMELPSPVLESVDPAEVYNGEDRVITVTGHDLFPVYALSTRRNVAADESTEGFSLSLVHAELEAVPLGGLTLVDYETLSAVVPRGVEPGVYDLELATTGRDTSVLEDALEVTGFKPTALEISATDVVHEVGEPAFFRVFLKDEEGNWLTRDVDLRILVTDDAGEPVEAFFTPGSLGQQAEVEGGIEGVLEDGTTQAGMWVDVPMTVLVKASPVSSREGIAGATQALAFVPGAVASLVIELPDDPMVATAGVPFSVELSLFDESGYPVEDANREVLLDDACSNFITSALVQSTATVEVVLKAATGSAACPVDRIQSLNEPFATSEDIVVLPGPLDHFEVAAAPSEVVAGEIVTVFVSPEDAYGNVTTAPTLPALYDDATGVELDDYACQDTTPIFCTATLASASPELAIRAEVAGVFGVAKPISVEAGPVAELLVGVSGNVRAGEPFDVTVSGTDAYGNDAVLTHDDVALTDERDELVCDAAPAAGVTFSCVLVTADGEVVLDGTHATTGATGSSAVFAVLNGAMASVSVSPQATSVVAGVGLLVDLEAFDAYGNAFFDGVKLVLLSDTSGTMTPASVTLGQAGTATVEVTFTEQGTTVVSVSQGGPVFGSSPVIDVLAGEAVSLDVRLADPWAWAESSMQVDLEALDAFANRADVDGAVTLSAATGAAEDVVLQLANGVGSGSFPVGKQPRTTEQLLAEVETGLSGASDPFPVVLVCGDDGPEVGVDFAGHDEAVVCSIGAFGVVSVSFASSEAAPSQSLIAFGLADVEGESALHVGNNAFTFPLEGNGYHELRALVVQSDGCAAEELADAWMGPPDGSAVGPVTVVPQADVLLTGQDTTAVQIQDVVDCSRDPAAGAVVSVRVDRGEVLGAASTGEGLMVALDAAGAAEVDWSAVPAVSGGEGTLRVWERSAFGSAAVTLSGDNLRPAVWSQEPAGQTDGLVEEVVLTFSEPLLASSVGVDEVLVDGSPVASVVVDGSVVVAELVSPVDASAGTHSVLVASRVRDLFGNRLDGAWSGSVSDYMGGFGPSAGAPAAVESCAASVSRFRPDGDDGDGEEADSVTITPVSADPPAWWVATVLDEAGVLVQRTRLNGTTTSSWSWDGRDATGRVVDDGRYELVVASEDAAGTQGGSCTVSVTVDNGPDL